MPISGPPVSSMTGAHRACSLSGGEARRCGSRTSMAGKCWPSKRSWPHRAARSESLSQKRVLVVDDDESLRRVTEVQLQQGGYHILTAACGREALELLQKGPVELVVTDLKMPGMSGLDLLKRIRADYPEIVVIMVTAFGTIETAVAAMRAGAYDYVTKPVHIDALKLTLGRAMEHVQLRQEVQELRTSLDSKYGFENRSEERRVGKEGRSRWSPDH